MTTSRRITPLFPLVSIRHLESILGHDREYLLELARSAGSMYRSYDRRVTGQSKWRHIDAPSKELRSLQKKILRKILYTADLPPHLLGSVKGRSVVDNMDSHIEPQTLARIDIADFFPSIENRSVYATYRNIFGASPKVADLLTKVTTFERRLPQGAPTSPMVANLVMIPTANSLQRICQERGLKLTIWVDDICISGRNTRDAIEPIIKRITRAGYAVRRSKIDVMPRSVAQTVTGGVVNKGRSVGRKKTQQIREEIISYKGSQEIEEFRYKSIAGKIQFISWVCPAQGKKLQSLFRGVMNGITILPIEKLEDVETRPCSRHRKCRRKSK